MWVQSLYSFQLAYQCPLPSLSAGQEVHGDWRLWVPGTAHGGTVASKRLCCQCIRYATGVRQSPGEILCGRPLQSTGNRPPSLTNFPSPPRGSQQTSSAQRPAKLSFSKELFFLLKKKIKLLERISHTLRFLPLRMNNCHFCQYYFTLPR